MAYDAIKASEGQNADAWAEIGAFIVAGRPEYSTWEEIFPEDVEEVNERGEVAELDDDDVPEGWFKCDGCDTIDLEENAVSTTYGAVCGDCDEMDGWRDD